MFENGHTQRPCNAFFGYPRLICLKLVKYVNGYFHLSKAQKILDWEYKTKLILYILRYMKRIPMLYS